MTDLDVHFWRFFALGAGFALAWRAYPWLATMGRAWRYWYFTLPDLARDMYAHVHQMMRSARPAQPFPEWYCRYVAWREVAFLERPFERSRWRRIMSAIGIELPKKGRLVASPTGRDLPDDLQLRIRES